MRLVRVSEEPESSGLPEGQPLSLEDVLALPETTLDQHEVIGEGFPEEESAAAPEVSVSGAVTTSADMVWSALAQTAAGRLLSGATLSISTTAGHLLDSIQSWWQSPSDSPWLTAIRDAANKIRSTIQSLALSAGTSLVESVNAAGACISEAVSTIGSVLKNAFDGAEEVLKSRLTPIIAAISPILQDISNVTRTLLQAGRLVAGAVIARASQIVASAAASMSTTLATVKVALVRVAAAASPIVTDAIQDIHAVLDGIRAALASFKEKGEQAVLQMLPAALEQMGASL